jgi:hypothetical protein
VSDRSILEVIDRVIAEIPESHGFISDDLRKLKTSCLYSAPELEPLRWREFVHVLTSGLAELDTDWTRRIGRIMRGEAE